MWHFVSLGLRSLDSHSIHLQGTGGEVAGLFGSATDPADMAKEVARGITAHGRSKSYHRRGLWAIKAKNGGEVRDTAALPPSPPPPRHRVCMHRPLSGAEAQRRGHAQAGMLTAPAVPPAVPGPPEAGEGSGSSGQGAEVLPLGGCAGGVQAAQHPQAGPAAPQHHPRHSARPPWLGQQQTPRNRSADHSRLCCWA